MLDRRSFLQGAAGPLLAIPAAALAADGRDMSVGCETAKATNSASNALHIGWYELHPDISLNFQLNRWAATGGPEWLTDVRPVLITLRDYESWRETFVRLGEVAANEGRLRHAALHFRSAEFFMAPNDPRKEPLRKRLLALFCKAAGVTTSSRREVVFGDLRLPAWSFPTERAHGTLVVFGGFDSYIEEFFPILGSFQQKGWSVVAFEGPGQGSVLEEQGAPLTRDWNGPVAAVLDAFNLDDVTLVGISLGGCLAIRAAAFEPRVRRVVAFDVLTDFFDCFMAAQPESAAAFVRGLLTVRADAIIDLILSRIARRIPLAEWGLARACRVFGCERPSEALRAAQALQTRDVSDRVRQDVLLLAGSQDHYVPLPQLEEQMRLLSATRSITARVFTAYEQAQAHCQVGNLPLAIGTISDWALKIGR